MRHPEDRLRPLLQMARRTSGIAVPRRSAGPSFSRGKEEEEAEGVEEEMVEEGSAALHDVSVFSPHGGMFSKPSRQRWRRFSSPWALLPSAGTATLVMSRPTSTQNGSSGKVSRCQGISCLHWCSNTFLTFRWRHFWCLWGGECRQVSESVRLLLGVFCYPSGSIAVGAAFGWVFLVLVASIGTSQWWSVPSSTKVSTPCGVIAVGTVFGWIFR